MTSDRTPLSVLLFGATGMVGQGALRECLLDPGVERVAAVGRHATHTGNRKFRDLVVADVSDLSAIEGELAGFDACFFCLGVSSAGMNEREYTRVTYDLTIAVARTLARLNGSMTFVYVSGMGTDSSERGRVMWARVKGRTENELGRIFASTYVFRPGLIVPQHGIRSRTRLYQAFYSAAGPLLPILRSVFPNAMTTTELIGRAMLHVARHGYPQRVLETRDINAAGAARD